MYNNVTQNSLHRAVSHTEKKGKEKHDEQCTQWRSLIDPQTKIIMAHSKNYNSPLRIIKYSCTKITFARLRKSIVSKAKNIVSIYEELVTQQRKLICSILKNSPPQNEKSIPSNTKKCTPAYDKYNPAYGLDYEKFIPLL